MPSITNDADYMLCSLYAEYCRRLKNGVPKSDAAVFGSAVQIQDSVIPEWSTYDITSTAEELCDQGLLDAVFGDMELSESMLTPKAVVYMETRFGRKFDRLVSRIAELRKIFG